MFRFFEKLLDPYPGDEPVTPPRTLLAFVFHYSRPVIPWLILMSVLTAVLSVMEVVFFGFLGDIVDWLAAADQETFFSDHAWPLAGIATLLLVVYPAIVLLQSLIMHQTIFGNYPMLARWLSHRYLLRQSLTFFHDEFAGRISQKVMQTALAMREAVLKLAEVIVYVAVYFTGALVLVARADPRLAIPMLLWLAGYVAILALFVPHLQRASADQADARALMTGRVVDSYTNIQTIKLFSHTRREQDYVRSAMSEFMVTVHRQMRLVTRLTLSLHMLNSLLLAGIGAVSLWAWHQGLMSLGAIAVALALVMRLRAMSQWVLWEVASLFENIGTVRDGITTISRPLAITDRPNARPLEVTDGEIRFERIGFSYEGRADWPVFRDLSLDVRPGERVGLVGRSGAGKSTLVNLLLRFHDLQAGRILIDGQDIVGVTQDSLRHHIGVVTQDTSLLHRTIRENIGYGRPNASEEDIIQAARRAHAHDFIQALSDHEGRSGYDAQVGERGVKLSGGQRQRIAIARVLLKDAPILILDEATSALDSEVEAAIQEQLYSLMEGKTVIAIAHRLSTIALMDRLVVMDAGRIIESGTHAELLGRGGVYAALWKRQSGGFLASDPGDEEAAPAAVSSPETV